MRLCRYDDNRLGLVEGNMVVDVTPALEALPAVRWPVRPGDVIHRSDRRDRRDARPCERGVSRAR